MISIVALLLAVSAPPGDPADPRTPSLDAPTARAPSTVAIAGAVTTPRFRIVHTEASRGAARYLAERVEALRDELEVYVGRDWPGVTEIRLGMGRAEYEGLALGRRPPSWAVALAYPAENVVLVEAHSLIEGDAQVTLRHELVHVALGQLGSGWPHWFQEGFAQEIVGERKYDVSHFATLAAAVARDRIFRFEDLSQGFPTSPGDVEIAYAQSLAMVEHLRERYGPQRLHRLIDLVGAGHPFERAFGMAFQSPLSAEERDLRDHLRRRYPWWPLLVAGSTSAWVVCAVLLVAAYVRRRRSYARWHADRRGEEALEDLALALLVKMRAQANDNALEPGTLPFPWLVTVVRRSTSRR